MSEKTRLLASRGSHLYNESDHFLEPSKSISSRALSKQQKDTNDDNTSELIEIKLDKNKISSDNNLIKSNSNLKDVRTATTSSLICNIILFLVKCYIVIQTGSMSVIASLVDSTLDLLSQVIMFVTERKVTAGISPKYPVGLTRLEPVAIMAVSILMIMTSVIVIREAVDVLIRSDFDISFGIYDVSAMGGVILLKFLLWIYCRRLKFSPIALTLAQDHINDVFSNGVALLAASLAVYVNKLKYSDAVGGILISLYIIYTWIQTAKEEVQKLIGKQADDILLDDIRILCKNHHKDVLLDILRGYHVGRNILIEVEIIMPESYTLKKVHDISLDLQNKIEKYSYVERAFVHVDYMPRDYNEHKIPTLS